MLINLTYEELDRISVSLAIIEAVYGTGDDDGLKNKIDEVIRYMDNAPITEVYPNLSEGVSTVST